MLGIIAEMRRQQLDRDVASQSIVVREKNLSHAARANLPNGAIRSDRLRSRGSSDHVGTPLCCS
jgi:hypothetical protein